MRSVREKDRPKPIGAGIDAGLDRRVSADTRPPEPGAFLLADSSLDTTRRLDGTADKALVVLGCRIAWTGNGRLAGAGGRRVRAAAETFHQEKCTLLVASGGRAWNGVVEADAMRDALVRLGVPTACVLCERCSLTTRGNAQFTSALLSRMGIDRALLVTCDWHMSRARALFLGYGLAVEVAPAVSPPARAWTRAWRWGRERMATRLDATRGIPHASP